MSFLKTEEERLSKLESLVDNLQRQVADLTAAKVQTEAELKTTQAMAKSALNECSSSSGWTLQRTQIVFPNLEKLALQRATPTYVETLPTPLPNNTAGGVASVENTHESVHVKPFNYEVMVPWDGTLADKLKFVIKHSYQTGGPDN